VLFRKVGFKEAETKTKCFRQRVKRSAEAMYSMIKMCFMNFKSSKCILAEPKHNIGTLRLVFTGIMGSRPN